MLTGSKSKDAIQIGILATILVIAGFTVKSLFFDDLFTPPEDLLASDGEHKSGKRLIRVVDLPDVAALHWRGGRYMDLGYLYDGANEKGGTWVAYLGPNEHQPLTQRELTMFLRLAAQQGVIIDPSVPPDPRMLPTKHAPSGTVSDSDRNTMDLPFRGLPEPAVSPETPKSVSAKDKGDALDAALLPPAEHALIIGMSSDARRSADKAGMPAALTSYEAPQTEASRSYRPGMASHAPMAGGVVRSASSDKGDLEMKAVFPDQGRDRPFRSPKPENKSSETWGILGPAGLILALMALVVFSRVRRRRSGYRLRNRMASVMNSGRQAGKTTKSKKMHAGSGKSHHTIDSGGTTLDPQQALWAMQAAATGGMH